MKQLVGKYLFLFWFGGSTYVTIEVLYRQRSHWSMFVLAGIVFISIGLLNEIWTWRHGLIWQILAGTSIATVGEFITGCIVNLWLGWNVWDYSNMAFHLCGQVCLAFTLLWMPISLLAIVVDDIIRWKFFGEDKPTYTLF